MAKPVHTHDMTLVKTKMNDRGAEARQPKEEESRQAINGEGYLDTYSHLNETPSPHLTPALRNSSQKQG